MVYYMNPKVLYEGHFRYGMFDVDNDGRLTNIGWSNELSSILRHKNTFDTTIYMWNKYYPIDNFITNISKDCIVFTKESHPEYFI